MFLKSGHRGHSLLFQKIFSSLFIVFFFLAWLIPDHYSPWRAFYNEYLMSIALLFLYLSEPVSKKKISCLLLVWLFAFIVLISQKLFASIYFFSDFFISAGYLFMALMVYQLGLSSIDGDKLFTILASCIVVGALCNVLIALSQWFGHFEPWMASLAEGRRVHGNLGQPNNLATLCVFGLVATSFLYFRNFFSIYTFFLVGFLLVLGACLTESRTPYLQFGFLGIWVFVSSHIDYRIKIKMFLMCIMYFLLSFTYPFWDNALRFTYGLELRIVEGEYSNRIALWEGLVGAVTQSPFLGYGWNQVSVAQFSHLDLAARVPYVEYSHNIIIDLLVYMGPLIGGVVVVSLSFWLIRLVINTSSHLEWTLVAGMGVIGAHAMVEMPLAYTFFLIPFFLMLGLADARQGRTLAYQLNFKWISSLIVPISVLGLVWIWREYRMIEEDHRVMRGQNFGLPIDKNLNLSKDVILLDGPRDFIQFGRMKASKGMHVDTLEWMRKVVYRDPLSVAIYRYSVALALNAQLETAEKELAKIRVYNGDEMYEYYRYYFQKSIEAGREI